MDTRRQFLARSGAAAAAVVLAPQDAASRRRRSKRAQAAVARRPDPAAGASPRACCRATRRPDAITLLTLVDDVGRRRPASGSRSRATRTSAASSRASDILDERGDQPLRQGARHRPAAARALLVPVRDARPPQPGRALPDRAAAGLPRDRPLRLLLLRRLHARLLQRLRARSPARTSTSSSALGDYIYAETYAAGRRRPRGPRRPDRAPQSPYHRSVAARGGDAAGVPREVRALPQRREPARAARSLPDGRHLGRPRGPEQLRQRRRRTAACRCASRFSRARRDAAYQAYFEAMPVFHARPQRGSTARRRTGARSS